MSLKENRTEAKNIMFLDEPSPTFQTTTVSRDVRQAGAICYRRKGNGHLEVLLVGNRRNARWGLPKGHLDAGETSDEAAGRESFEEAGVVGQVDTEVFGSFVYAKENSPHRYQVAVHLLRVTDLADDFPEKAERKQKWFPLKTAVRNAAQPGLRALLAKLETVAL